MWKATWSIVIVKMERFKKRKAENHVREYSTRNMNCLIMSEVNAEQISLKSRQK
ncbi:predicted protein [Sclerotinia sclerotiorum 1980 UF-70]|uniref:Uncharacterized protein n=1 Tax=Sclerotinia sclerotiorum (strain ATCC 18683 / 1980 / Ss-1) TaxID=665079 RepID=A7ELP2_SCLS1|nr:predicted protein [Sclerotinia sclerotiorum 1980 UF-70]EDO03758.1 predicted protein [Sclerotinia sclerotiorum 1980 UF-70]